MSAENTQSRYEHFCEPNEISPELALVVNALASAFRIENLQTVDEQAFRQVEQLLKVGEKVEIEITTSDFNRKRVGATQANVEINKLENALTMSDDEKAIAPVSATLSLRINSKGEVVSEVFIRDGHHRMAVNLIEGKTTVVKIVDTWDQTRGEPKPSRLDNNPTLGFNKIVSQIRSLLSVNYQ